jgi:murein DD-endopeptidase MepM/ murein hydrolase activator NlpD
MKNSRALSILLPLILLTFSVNAQAHYTVQPGDTLYAIARRLSVTQEALMNANNIKDPSLLKIGQVLKLPDGSNSYETYQVKRGDTLFGIARRHNTSADELSQLNGIEKDSLLKVGVVLKVPAARESEESETQRTAESAKEIKESSREEENSSLIWPHSGNRQALSGKLKGIEILGEAGDEVVAVNSGNVVWVAPYRGYGRLVMVEGADKAIYAYGGHEETYVQVGDRVSPGMILGTLGLHPIDKRAKMFFFVYKDGEALDPAGAPRG